MSMIVNNFPEQNLSYAEKMRKAEGQKIPEWVVQNSEYFSTEAQYFSTSRLNMYKLLNLVHGEVEDDDYAYSIDPHKTLSTDGNNSNPFNKKDSTKKTFPAKLRNYNIIKPVVDRMMGDFRFAFKTPSVFAKTSSDVNLFLEEKDEYMKSIAYQKVFAEMQNAQIGTTQQEQSENKSMKEYEEEFLLKWSKRKAKSGQQALDFMVQSLDIETKALEMFFYYIVFGEVYSSKEVNHDDVLYEAESPLNIDVIGWGKSNYAEDAFAIIKRESVLASDIIDKYGDKLKETYGEEVFNDLYKISAKEQTGVTAEVREDHFVNVGGVSYVHKNDGTLMLEHLMWKSLVKRGHLTYIDDYGQLQEDVVDEDYELNTEAGDLNIEWVIENEWWEVKRLRSWRAAETDGYGKIYLDWGPGVVQRSEVNNTSICKLPINGVRASYVPNTVESKVKIGEPYQALYNIFHYRFELTMARNKDKILAMPLGLVPQDWSVGRFMDSIHSFSTLFFNEQAPRAQAAIQAIKSIDLSLSQYMASMWEIMQQIKQEYWDAVNMNRQRFGDVTSRDGKATTQQAIYSSSLGDLNWIRRFEEFLDKDFEGLLDYSKVAWANGKQGVYSMGSNDLVMMQIDGGRHAETEYGIFPISASREKEKIEYIKNNLLQPMAQNGAAPSTLIKVMKEDNLIRIEEIIEKGERVQQKLIEQQRQFEGEQAERDRQAEQAENEAERALKKYEIDMKAAIELEKNMLMADSFNAKEGDVDGDGVSESEAILARSRERVSDIYERLNNQRTYQMQRENMQLQREKMASQERIAKENKNKYDK